MLKPEHLAKFYPHIITKFVAIDIETTGLDAVSDEILEIGGVVFENGVETNETFSSIISISRNVPSEITELTGISQAMVSEHGQPLGITLIKFEKFVSDMPIIAYKADFDKKFLDAAFSKLNKNLQNKFICSLEMAKEAWSIPNYKLATVAKFHGFSTSGVHRALKDSRLAGLIYLAAAKKLGPEWVLSPKNKKEDPASIEAITRIIESLDKNSQKNLMKVLTNTDHKRLKTILDIAVRLSEPELLTSDLDFIKRIVRSINP